ncbi:CHASE3 domain-containing protein [Fontivita pretiosa]|uniref:hybrid sensor histidine kinase/response regulator n=1 Tax=Fontivita pretiosa TaxID=2989684 RepID=UPI003D170627
MTNQEAIVRAGCEPCARWQTAARGMATGVVLVGLGVLLGWQFGIEPLMRLRPGMVAMNPATASAFVLCGAALWMLARGQIPMRYLHAARLCAALAMVIGLVRLVGYSTGIDLGIDRLLFASSLDDGNQPGPNRMAPNTASAFVCCSLALLLLTAWRSRWRMLGSVPALIVLCSGFLTVIGYLNGVSSLAAVGRFIPMALHTAVTFIALAGGLLLVSYARVMDGTEPPSEAAAGDAERRATVGMVAALVVMSVVGIASYKSLGHFIGLDDSRERAQEVLAKSAETASIIKDAEAGVRGYVITGDEAFLRPYQSAVQGIGAELDRLEHLTSDSPHQQNRLEQLRWLIQTRMAAFQQVIELRRTQGFDAARARVSTGEGRRLMDQIRQLLSAIAQQEHDLLDEKKAAAAAGARVTIAIVSVGSGIGFVLVAAAGWLVRRDMLARSRAEQQMLEAKLAAERASRAKSEFLAHMSHEIRTPLNGVIGMLDLLLGTTLSEQQRRYAALAKSSARSLTGVINDILDFSKIEAGKLEILPSELNLRHLVEEVVEMQAQSASSKGLKLACHTDAAVPTMVRADGDRLRQILVNLVNNAIKFTHRGSVVVRVTCDQLAEDARHATIRFAVCDTGIGIAPDRYDRLFKAFSQADASTTRSYGGTGLGLAISRRLAELMGGQIGVQSQPGAGSTFWFTVVVEPLPQQQAPSPSQRLDPRTLRVLAVDGDELQRQVLGEQIASWGLEAVTVSDARIALESLSQAAARSDPFRVVIVDDAMPGMDAYEFAATVKRRPAIREAVLMILVSLNSQVDPQRLRAAGFCGHMTKPLRQSQLFNAIMDAIAASQRDPSPLPDWPVVPPAALPAPARAAGLLPRPRPATSDDSGAGDGRIAARSDIRILLAEDNEINQIVASEVLANAGYRCDTVVNGRLAVQAVSQQRYDLILMDCQMPEMDGFDATREIRRLEQAGGLAGEQRRRVPIVALTANAMRGDRERCLEAGMDAYASKPINPDQLLATIRQVLSDCADGRCAA